ncbi:MAG: hypothetical protein L0211_09300, partial [Planctomycetaceae bacterium]|nr:hypothetical protein [Planctomycetaceae bacterium]
ARKPDFPGTFAPLVGMLLDEAAGARHEIDFLHPRKTPPPPSQKRTLIAAAAAVAAVVLLALGGLWWQLSGLDARIRTLQTQRNNQEKLAKQGAKPREDAAKVDRFTQADVTWLDELALVSRNFPPPDALIVEDLVANYEPKGGGELTVSGLVDQDSRILELQAKVRDNSHSVSGIGAKFDPEATGSRKWRYKETVTVRLTDEGAAPAPAAAAKGKTPAKAAPSKAAKPSAKGGQP